MKEIIRQDISNRMSQSISVNGFIFFSGQVADDLSGDIKNQTQCVLNKIEALLEKNCVKKSNLIDIKIYLRDGEDFDLMNEVYERWLGGCHQPVRICLVSDFPNPNYLIEIQAMAANI